MNKRQVNRMLSWLVITLLLILAAFFLVITWENIPITRIRWTLAGILGSIFMIFGLYILYLRHQTADFADKICLTIDDLISQKTPTNYCPYEDSLEAKVEDKLIHHYEILQDARQESQRDKELIQTMVSDISHQVKTPIASARMFTNILQKHDLAPDKRSEFLALLESQIEKLDFLMKSLIKMSRLETGTLLLNLQNSPIYDTIAQSLSAVWVKADIKDISLIVDCDSNIIIQHDPKWTAEAFMNLLDNAVKYTPKGGTITISVKPWQFYTKIDITDTGIGILEEDYNHIFKRFYRTQEVAAEEGVGLGLYLAQGIITKQKGYISVKSVKGKSTTFSVYLLSN